MEKFYGKEVTVHTMDGECSGKLVEFIETSIEDYIMVAEKFNIVTIIPTERVLRIVINRAL